MSNLRKKASQTIQWPPTSPRLHETDEERGARLISEAEAKRVSDSIDRQLEVDRLRKKQMHGPKILLLGMWFIVTWENIDSMY
jgi:hypothetical protein